MARSAGKAIILAAGLGLGGADSEADLQQRVAEIRSLLSDDGARLQAVSRRLPQTPPSIYSGEPGRREYKEMERYAVAASHQWLLLCSFLVMFMHAGFAMLKAGLSRVRSVQSVLLMGLLDLCTSALAWWIVGWSFAYSGPVDALGHKKNGLFGFEQFAGRNFLTMAYDRQLEPSGDIVRWFHQWAVCSVAVTIVSGSLIERVNVLGYLIYCTLMSALIYPFLVGSTWGGGWLKHRVDFPGFLDFAGSGIVHFAGGLGALVGAVVSGPRDGRFWEQSAMERVLVHPEDFIPHSQPLVVTGTFMLWFGWYGLNCGATLGMENIHSGMLAAQVAMNTTISAAMGGVVAVLLRLVMKRKSDLDGMCCGILAGLVSISAACSTVESGMACIIGAVGGMAYVAVSALLRVLRVDDPVDAFAVHGVCGAWGVACAAFLRFDFDLEKVYSGYGYRCLPDPDGMRDCVNPGYGVALANLYEVLAIAGWVGGTSMVVFSLLNLTGLLRSRRSVQEAGLDKRLHFPPRAYNFGVPAQAEVGLHSV